MDEIIVLIEAMMARICKEEILRYKIDLFLCMSKNEMLEPLTHVICDETKLTTKKVLWEWNKT